RQQLVEVALVATLGLLGALAMGRVAVDLLPRLLPGEVPFWLSFELDGRVLVWSGTLAALCCVAVALPTTVQARRAGAASRGLAGRRLLSSRGRTWLVGAQVALATMLVGSAAAAVKGVAYLSRAETGVRTDNILVTGAAIPPSSYPEAGDRIELARRALDAVRTLPSVVSAGGVDVVPLVSGGQEVALDDGSVGNDVASRAPVGLLNAFSPGYFETMGIPVLSGRLPVDADVWGDPTVAVVSQSLALRLWPEGEAVGRRIRYGAPGSRSPRVAADRPWLEVVAVVGDVSQEGPVRGTRDQVYVTMARQPPAHLTLMIRTRSDPLDQAGPVQQRIHEIDPVLPFFEPTTMAHARRFSVWTQRMTATLLSTFGLLAGLLAILGVYAVMAHTTRRRDREIGLRVAIGASRGDVRGLILRQSAGLVIPGLGAGLVGVGLASLVLRRVVVGIPAVDPVVLSATAVLLTLAALAAAWVPARRAAGIDPAAALSAD
ncbi:MAG: ABC transporter permease, partial [Gemmatimonadota bacterium]|nr:ABC transporter permease [Gemmatimonadota bacterium]